jgi:uncharacterized repeat protein (TIGR03803 family)
MALEGGVMKHFRIVRISIVRILALAAIAAMLSATGARAASRERVLYNFQGGSDGSYPMAGLVTDKAGNLYGTTSAGGSGSCSSSDGVGCGTVFELSSVAGGGWTEKVIYTFQGGQDGSYPEAGLTFDAAGNLYGVTRAGGGGACNDLEPGCGTVFELTPGIGGAWTESVLYRFQGGNDGATPISGLIFDHAGNLYGTTAAGGGSACQLGCGTVFKLTPSTQGWVETIVYAFAGGTDGDTPQGRLVPDKAGSLYGATNVGGVSGFGTIFKLSPNSSGAWSETILYSFRGYPDGSVPNGVISDKAGDLYGTNFNGGHNGYGALFELSSTGKESLLFNFGGGGGNGEYPRSGLTFDVAGNLYGTTEYVTVGGSGEVFALTPNTQGGWTKKTLYVFSGGSDGGQPFANVILDSRGHVYGTTWTGGTGNCSGNNGTGCGVVFEIVQ